MKTLKPTPKNIHPLDLEDMETFKIVWPFEGRNHGQPFTRIRQADLRRIASRKTKWGFAARRELKRRGTQYIDNPVEISYHAFDSISLLILDMFMARSDKSKGIKTWAVNLAAEALAWGNQDGQGRYVHQGVKFVFDFNPVVPVLITVLDNRKK